MTKRQVAMVDLRAAYLIQQEEIDAAITRVMRSGWYILGAECAAFESDFAHWCGAPHAVGVGNGTDAIVVALRGLGIGEGDTVFTVSHTAVATVAAIELAGAAPVLVDIDPATYTIASDKLEDAVKDTKSAGGRPRAVVAVHLYGHPCDVKSIAEICRRHELYFIEDCAQAHGATVNGNRVSAFGNASCFSFYPTKNLGAFGDGGAVVTHDDDLAKRCAAIRQYGWRERFLSDMAGLNSRLDELQAAMLAVRLRRLDEELMIRRAVAERYNDSLGDVIETPITRPGVCHAYHLYVTRSPKRDALAAALKARGVGFGVHYPVPVHLQAAYFNRVAIARSGMEETERASREVLSLPMHAFLNDDDVAYVIESVRASIKV